MGGVRTVTLMFTDAKGSTRLLEELGQERAEPVIAAYHETIRRAVESHRGREVKWMHDGGLYAFSSPAAAVHCAIAVQLRCRAGFLGRHIKTRIGLDAGEIEQRGEDFFGLPGVVASRLCDKADAESGQILCTHTVRGLLAGQRTFAFKGARMEALNGLDESVSVFQVEYDTGDRRVIPARMPFIGRDVELEALDAALSQAVSGQGGVVWLSGEAGIGKTRLVEEFSSLARRRARMLFGGCREGDAARPYAPFAEALASYAREHDGGELEKLFGPRAGLIARFVPEINERLPIITQPQGFPLQDERFRLLDAVSTTLIALTQDRPLMLVLDDLHWADSGTVDMLLGVARFSGENRLLIAGLYRGDSASMPRTHPLRRCLAELPRRVPNYREIALGNLERSTVSGLLRSIDREISRELAEAICDYTGGNPFFVRETLSHMYGEGGAIGRGRKLGTTARASEVVRRRVSGLSEAAQNLLRVACAFEGTFDFGLIQAVSGLESKQATDAIDESIGAQVLWPARDPEHYEFIHALVRDVLYRDMGPQTRVAQHRRIARALEQLPEGRPERASEIAYQYGRCGSSEDAERAVDYALAAAEQAEAAYDYARVAKLCQQVRATMDEHDGRLPGLLRRLALAQAWALDPEASMTTVEAGQRTASSQGPAAAADFLAQAHVILRDMGTDAEGRRPIITQGLGYNGDRRGPAWMSFTLLLSRDDPRSFSYTERSRDLELVEKIGEALSPEERARYRFRGVFPRNRDQALRSTNLYDRVWYCGEYESVLEELRIDAEECEREARIPRAVDSWAFFARCCSTLGRLHEASKAVKRAAKLLERIPGARVSALQLDGARNDLRRARGYTMPERVLAHLELNLQAPPNGSTDTEPDLAPSEEALGQPWAVAPLVAALASAYAEVGRRGDALRHLNGLRDVIAKAFVGWDMYQGVAWLAAETLWWLNAREQTTLIELVANGIEEKIRKPGFCQSMTDARLALARLVALQGRSETAEGLLDDARSVLQKQDARTLLAIADYDQALMHHRWGQPGDGDHAQTRLQEATEQFNRLSMWGWLERARHLSEEIGAT